MNRKTHIAVMEKRESGSGWDFKVEDFCGNAVCCGTINSSDLNDAIVGVCHVSKIERSKMCICTRG